MARRITLGKPLGGFLAGAGLDDLALAGGNVHFVNPGAGSNTSSFFDGKSSDKPYATVAEAYANTSTGKNDVVLLIGQATADILTATIAWNTDYTHLIGVGGGKIQDRGRSRIMSTGVYDLTQLVTFSGVGCRVQNIHFSNEADVASATHGVVVSGIRNQFIHCHFAGCMDTGTSAIAASDSLLVTGTENEFIDCTIGNDTVLRGAANVAVMTHGATSRVRNIFRRCKFISYSETAASIMARFVTAERGIIFEDCLFYNFSQAWAHNLTDCFSVDDDASTYDIILQGNNRLVGITGWAGAGSLAHIWIPNINGAGTSGIELNPTA
jgi:hypothetical protein